MKLLYTLLLFTGFSLSLFAQKPANAPRPTQNQTQFQKTPSGHIRCATVEMEAERMRRQLNTNYVDDFERWIAPKVAKYKQKAARTGAKSVVYTIPVVVHVIHNGDPIGTDENISDAQILSQIQVMNEDFRKIAGTPGDGSGVDVEIEFCMAQYDPSGNPTNGIDRIDLGQASWNTNASIEGTLKPSTQWDPTLYLNMWTCRFGGSMAGILGYAQFPDASGLGGLNATGGAANTDGVIMAFDAFGSSAIAPGGSYNAPYDLGRTTTHEVGHWLGLRHIWGDDVCGVDDFCADTPESDDANYNCATGHVSCGTVDMVENYMDYSNDACMNVFTADQKARMIVVMNNSPRRMELASSPKCAPPTPTIAFDLDQTTVAEGTDCNYQEFTLDLNIALPPSDDAVVTFVPSGTATQGLDYDFFPASVTFLAGQQNTQTLTVRIYNDGVIEATEGLTIGMNLTTVGDAILTTADTRQHVFTLQDDDYAPMANQLVDVINVDFESGVGGFTTSGNTGSDLFGLGTAATASSGFWTIDNSNATTIAYTNDDNCNCDKAADYLYSPVFSLLNANSTSFSFDHAFADIAPETGTVSISTNGAAGPFVQILTLSNTFTNNGGGSITTPWVTVNSNLDAYIGQNNLMLRFEYNDGNDWMYGMALDNILLQANMNTNIQEDVNTANNDDIFLGPNQTVYFYDPATTNVMGSIENTSAWDYGCSTLEVDRSTVSNGAPTANFMDLNPANALMAKTFYLNPSTNNASGTYNATFYFTEAEVAAWEAATGKTRADLKIIKVANDRISNVNPGNYAAYNIEILPATLGAFGANGLTLSASFSTGFSGFGFGDPDETLLANTLVLFNAEREGDAALLSWETASEEGCNSFTLQRSANGIDFDDLVQVPAEGQAAFYQKRDLKPLNGYNYYRLLQHFDNGEVYKSAVKVLNMSRTKLEAIRLQPNPAQEQISLFFHSYQAGDIQFQIIDALGRQISPISNIAVEEGQNRFELPLQDFAAGIYFLRIQQASQSYNLRFVKQ